MEKSMTAFIIQVLREASFVESIFQSIEFGAKPLETSRLQPPTTGLKPLPVRQQLRKNILPQIELQQLER